MALFDFFKKKTDPVRAEKSIENNAFTQKRRHHRYELNTSDLCTLELEGPQGICLRLRNISHFGCLTEDLPQANFEHVKVPVMGTVSVAGRSHPVEITNFNRRSGGYGVTFRHSSVEALHAMGELILPLHWGASAACLGEERSVANPPIRRLKFRGEGQLELIIESSDSDEVQFVMGTFMLPGGHYVSVIWDGTNLTTKKMISPNDPSARMSKTEMLDLLVVRMCAAACLGVKRTVTDKCASLLCKLAQG